MALTARQVYEGTLIELNKIQAPSMLLEDFNYFINKAINQYINKKYSTSYDINQQATDDLRVLKATQILDVTPTSKYGGISSLGDVTGQNSFQGATYEAMLPSDYLHLLNCVCSFYVHKNHKCYDAGTFVQFGATRLTSDLYGQIINNFYMKPSYKRPYYFLHNVNQYDTNTIPTNPWNGKTGTASDGTDMVAKYYSVKPGSAEDIYVEKQPGDSNAPRTITLGHTSETTKTYYIGSTEASLQPQEGDIFWTEDEKYYFGSADKTTRKQEYDGYVVTSSITKVDEDLSLVERNAAHRYGNNSGVRIELRVGKLICPFYWKQ